jgi:hypothetical protein
LELDRYYSCWSTGKAGQTAGNDDCIEDPSNEDEERDEGQGDSSVEEEEEKEMKEERDASLDKEEAEQMSAVMHTQAGYACVDVRRKWIANVTTDDDQQARKQTAVLEDSMSASNLEKQTIRKAVPFSKQPAMADHLENITSRTPKASKVPR